MAQLIVTIPDTAIPKMLRGFEYNAQEDGPAQEFVKQKVIEFLKLYFRRGDRFTHEDAFVEEPFPNITL